MNYQDYRDNVKVAKDLIAYIKGGTRYVAIHWRTDEPKGQRGIASVEVVTPEGEHLMDVPVEWMPLLLFLTAPIESVRGDVERRVLNKSFLATIVHYAKDEPILDDVEG